MKTKIIKSKGYYRLVVDDKAINAKYNCKREPIVLGIISEINDSGQWCVYDYRLKQNLLPSSHLVDIIQSYKPENDEEKAFLSENLHTFDISEKSGAFSWSKFDCTLYEGGDHPWLTDKTIKNIANTVSTARFTFKKAFKLLQEQKEFWEKFDKDNLQLDEVRISNPYRQITETYVSINFLFEKDPKNEEKKKRFFP